LYLFKKKIIFNSVKFVATKKVQHYTPPPLLLLLLLDLGSGVDKIRIRDKYAGSATLMDHLQIDEEATYNEHNEKYEIL
jgi:hypothetical protein